MNFRESFLTALAALVANKLRALLTMLGIIIGVAAVITMIAIGGGATVVQFGSSVRMRNADADAIRARVSTIDAVVPEFNRNTQVKYENRNWNTRIVGTT